ncbi:substrate-binding domain-containing protein [Prosthecobacter dejongeii]|uniref:LacI family transcriptional regulator n=1 Tax=Prosthecobacter dejongeii TaxID=48465 RepID=A0A7W8DT09_9BACT|nr:substrate-binding domain-containing protein [Prosthecobacter dejongeii]MBB5040401.1 LacI family transcriptional regulator [Prosthecobacter dejongeii]
MLSDTASLSLPVRPKRAAEVAVFLRECLLKGTWPRYLPGEMELAHQLQVGRNTLRAALAQLESEGLVKTHMGRRREVTGCCATVPPPTLQTAWLLLCSPPHTLASSTLLWMETLRLRLQGAGWHLQMKVVSAAFRSNPTQILETLTSEHPHGVWILHRSTQAMQRWFENQGIKTVIAGTPHAGISLPQVDTDYRATSRHAATRLTALGHQHLVIVASQVKLAGDAESVAGFQEGAGQAQVQVMTHQDTPASVIAGLRRLFAKSSAPTAFFVLRADHLATVQTWLLGQGYRIPGQISLLSRDDESFLLHLHPEPARYRRSAETFAKKLARLVISCGEGRTIREASRLLMPEFLRGESLGPAPIRSI